MDFNEKTLLQILDLFVKRPDTSGTADGLALYLQRNPSEIESVLEFLVRTGVLKTSSYGEVKVYQFIPSLIESEKEDIKVIPGTRRKEVV